MLKRILGLLLVVCAAGCVEPYEFVIKNNEPALVVEAFVSDKSFNETLSYPSNGRYFTVKLTMTSDVTNVRPPAVTSAHVQLFSDKGYVWEYIESDDKPGFYFLLDDDFKAESGMNYKLSVKLQDESSYESDWESLPEVSAPAMGQITFREEDIQKYVIKANKEVLKTVKGMWTLIELPENATRQPLYYRWTSTPHWIYVAPLASSASPGYKCWVTNSLSVQNYAIQLDRNGNYRKDLFFMETIRNERIFERYSNLIVQHAMTDEFFFFWKEMQEQNEDGIFDNPPYNLHTNFHSLSGGKKVSGYFGVVQEQAKRWYFDKTDLSYYVDNTLKKDCTVPFQDPAPECFDCLEYSFGLPTNVKPQWWQD